MEKDMTDAKKTETMSDEQSMEVAPLSDEEKKDVHRRWLSGEGTDEQLIEMVASAQRAKVKPAQMPIAPLSDEEKKDVHRRWLSGGGTDEQLIEMAASAQRAKVKPAPMPSLEKELSRLYNDCIKTGGSSVSRTWMGTGVFLQAARADMADARKADQARIAELEHEVVELRAVLDDDQGEVVLASSPRTQEKENLMKTTVQSLKLNAQTHIDMAEKSLAKFSESFLKDPQEAFRWGEEALKAAATRSVWISVREHLSAHHPDLPEGTDGMVEAIRQLAISQALRLAEPYRSSNELANLLHARECAAWAAVASFIK
jgi:asparagine synthetase B (glutamine-hydrolysing)